MTEIEPSTNVHFVPAAEAHTPPWDDAAECIPDRLPAEAEEATDGRLSPANATLGSAVLLGNQTPAKHSASKAQEDERIVLRIAAALL